MADVAGLSKGAFSSRLPSLDGWRAVSIALVLGMHSTRAADFPGQFTAAFYWMFDGDLGVRCFFLISGLLITWLMLLEKRRSGRVDLERFYVRRCLRILPVYFAYLAVLAALQAFTPYAQSTAQWLANLTFTTNFLGGNWSSGHLWSLAVEEQFYLLWPPSFVLLGLAVRPRLALQVFCLVLVVAPLARVISYVDADPSPLLSGYSPLKYMDSLAIGCACAVILDRNPTRLERCLTARPWQPVLAALALVFTPYILSKKLLLGVFTVPLGPTCQALGLAVLVLQSLFLAERGFYRVLNWRWVGQIGILSYSIYIWQQLFCTSPETFGIGQVWWLSFPGWLVAVFAASLLSYYGLERPLFSLRSRFR